MPAYWDVENGVFAPFHLKPNGFSEELLQLLSPVAFPEDATLYFRGSLLEEENPHPAADLDLALVSQGLRPNGQLVREIVESVSALGKQVDLSVMSLDQLKCSLPMRLLLHTRAVKLHGQEYSLEPVPATMETVAAHLTAYAPSFPPDVFVASVRSRVSALKNLTRCFGCFSFADGGRFTREISACLRYADELDPVMGRHLRFLWANIEVNKPLDLGPVKVFIAAYASKFRSAIADS